MSEGDKTIRVGSRKSELALIQTKHVIALLQKLYRNKKFEIHTMSTIGDRVLNVSLPKIGEKSLFTRDLEDALRNGGVDFVVHSLKDLPTVLPTGMAIGAVLEREDARDALVLRESLKQYTLQTLPAGSVIGTSSLRRTAQLKRLYPHLIVCDIRGNLNTRLAKLDASDGKYSGIILAQAGLVRMGWMSRISQVLDPTDLLYAVGQGALAVECRANDNEILEMLRTLNCLPTTCRILAERSFLKTLGGGCSAPVAVVSKLNGAHLVDHHREDSSNTDENETTSLALEGAVWSLNGVTEVRDQLCCTLVAAKRVVVASIGAIPLDGDSNGNSMEGPPPEKRLRQTEKNSENGSPQRRSPPVINDDLVAVAVGEGKSFDLKTLIEKHIDLAKKCPVIGNEVQAAAQSAHDNNNSSNITRHSGGGDAGSGGGGGGDADCQVAASSSSSGGAHCPLRIDVGQDFMGQCPFVSNETKVSLASVNMCPITPHAPSNDGSGSNNNDQVDRAAPPPPPPPPNLSACPFHAKEIPPSFASADDAKNASSSSGIHPKCPFLQKTIEMFDYGDEEKPLPKKDNILIEDIDDLFCGLYQHKCFNRDLYVKANELGQQLADNLIKKGALDVMRFAQAEIHSKIS